MQSILQYSEENNINIKKIYGISLVGDDKDIPYWNSTILNNYNTVICNGLDGTGDLYKLSNVLNFINITGKTSCSLVTADGGFDYTKDFEQELSSYKLIYSEIFIALNIQLINGSFICKCFDLFHYSTLQLIFILYLSYDNISFIKPLSSRQSNSEKYIVCRGFKGYNKEYSNLMCRYFGRDILPIKLPQVFINMIQIYHKQFINYQVERINKTLYIINQRLNLDKPSKSQIKLAIEWCKKYKIPLNKNCYYLS